LYDPSTGNWIITGNMNEGRDRFTATLLNNGQVLVAGGYSAGSYLNSTELYDPSTDIWTKTANMNNVRYFETVSNLVNGNVLVIGGLRSQGLNDELIRSCEEYDILRKDWIIVGNLIHARARHTASVLTNGKVLVAGGNQDDGSRNSTELF
jgi:N-acetylneuraminic acid mutarotase